MEKKSGMKALFIGQPALQISAIATKNPILVDH